jgi:hypothetical protein
MVLFTKQTHLSGSLSSNPRDLHVYRHGRRDLTMRSTGGLEALEFVQGLVEAPL